MIDWLGVDVPKGITLAEVLASDCCVPDCAADAAEDMPFPICARHYIKIIRHFHQERVAPSGYADSEWDALHSGRQLAPEVLPEPKPEYVYFLRYRDRIKIGTTINLKSRLAAHPHDEVLAVIPGGFPVEHDWHKRFAAHRDRGEWFSFDDDMLDTIRRLGVAAAA